MTAELTILACAALLQVLQFCLLSVAASRQLGIKITAGSRDNTPEMTGMTGRIARAFNNHNEGLVLFTIAVVLVTLGEQSTPITQFCAYTYIVARLAYVPAYLSGIPYLRSVIWFVGFGATTAMILITLI